MGNDGGSIPKRRELVKEAARNPTAAQIKETQNEQQEYYWSTDPISRKPLTQPIVSDSNGRLYNKDSILEHLLSASDLDSTSTTEAETILQGAVKSLKDVVELQFTLSSSATNGTTQKERYICPVTNDVLGPFNKAVYLVPCGHVLSASALKEVSGEEKCVVCDTPHAPNDVIPILPTAQTDILRLQLRAKTLREAGLSHSLKKAGKDKKKKDKKKREREEDEAPKLAEKKSDANGGGGINNSSTKALTEKVMLEQEKRKKARMDNENLKSLFSSRDQSKPMGKSSDFMTRGFEIPAAAKR
ncbi:DUF602-domain-containing protein [Myriangium duriaei CBS 260.36]|uniref:DUF602-domain-containing protein n=1 Tax=Myriangium duriaei CBS 260.36 TaxID=1168546 RepID=A0A9P4IZK1_9PEZI|nr:DUF602-domain-containing protein [Myriangium duriaei CBS 260.36]